jgi:hypothetical protein
MACEGCVKRREIMLAWMREQMGSFELVRRLLTPPSVDANPTKSSETSKQGKE